jgi:hypothetical protein
VSELQWTPDTVELQEFDLWQRNPKRMSRERARRLLASWREMGQYQTLAIGPDGQCYDGHQRVNALRAAGYDGDYRVRVLRSSRPLTDEERERVVIESSVGTVGALDWDQLASWDPDALGGWGLDAEAAETWQNNLANFELMQEAAEDEPPDDPGAKAERAEELREKWGVEEGDLWVLGEHRLICGDCADPDVVARVMDGEKADAVVTDPPYGMNWNADASRFSGGKFGNHPRGRERDDVRNDDRPFDPAPYLNYPVVVLWGMNHYCEKLQPGGVLVWIKKPDDRFGTFLSDCELAWTNVGHGVYAIRHEWGGITRESERGEFLHPTQKPVAVIEWTIKQTKAGELIFDPFSGSGPTLIACERLGRRCRAVEIEPKYVAVSIERWAEMTGGTPERMV